MNNLDQQTNFNQSAFPDNFQNTNPPKDYLALRAVLMVLIFVIWLASLLSIILFLSSGLDYQAGTGIGIILGKYIIIALFISLFLAIINIFLVYKAQKGKVLSCILLFLSLVFSIGFLLFYNYFFGQEIQESNEYNKTVEESIDSVIKANVSEIEFPSDIKENIFQKGQLLRTVDYDLSGMGEFSKDVYYFDESAKSLKQLKSDFWIQNGIDRATQYSPSFQRLILSNNSDEFTLLDFKNKRAFKLKKYSGHYIIIDKETGVFYTKDQNFNNYVLDEEKLKFKKSSQNLSACDDVNVLNQENTVKIFLDNFGLSAKQNLFKNLSYPVSWVSFGESNQLGLTNRTLFFSDSKKKELYIIDDSVQGYSFDTMCNTNK